MVEVLCWLLGLCGITSESLLLLASVSGKSDSVAALNVTVVGYSSWILSKTKQSDFLMQFSLIVDGVRMNVVVFKSGVPFWKKTQSQIETTNTGELYL